MKYKINWDEGVFAVPDRAADSLKLADGNAVKVLLYIAKFKTQNGICEHLGINEEELEDALSFWQNTGVIYDEREQPRASAETSAPAVPEPPPKAKPVPPKPAKLMSAGEVADKINGNPEIRAMFDAIQVSLGRQLTFDDQNTVIWIYEHLGLKPEVILMLINYCKGIGRGNMHYIQKLAVVWADEGIDSTAAADRKILILEKNNTLFSKCAARMNLNRGLTSKEKDFAEKWSAAGADIELIMNAYERTVDSTGKVSFPYMNKILTNWLENGIRTVAEADAYSAATAPERKAQAEAKRKPDGGGSGGSSFDAALSEIIERSKTTPIIP